MIWMLTNKSSNYYMFRGKHNKALQAVNQAISQYPFSIELITIKAQIFSNLEEYDQALEVTGPGHMHCNQMIPKFFLPDGIYTYLCRATIQMPSKIMNALATCRR